MPGSPKAGPSTVLLAYHQSGDESPEEPTPEVCSNSHLDSTAIRIRFIIKKLILKSQKDTATA